MDEWGGNKLSANYWKRQ